MRAEGIAKRAKKSFYFHPMMKVREVVALLESNGWILVRTKGSHRQFKQTGRIEIVTVPGNSGDELAPGTLQSILKIAGLKRKKPK